MLHRIHMATQHLIDPRTRAVWYFLMAILLPVCLLFVQILGSKNPLFSSSMHDSLLTTNLQVTTTTTTTTNSAVKRSPELEHNAVKTLESLLDSSRLCDLESLAVEAATNLRPFLEQFRAACNNLMEVKTSNQDIILSKAKEMMARFELAIKTAVEANDDMAIDTADPMARGRLKMDMPDKYQLIGRKRETVQAKREELFSLYSRFSGMECDLDSQVDHLIGPAIELAEETDMVLIKFDQTSALSNEQLDSLENILDNLLLRLSTMIDELKKGVDAEGNVQGQRTFNTGFGSFESFLATTTTPSTSSSTSSSSHTNYSTLIKTPTEQPFPGRRRIKVVRRNKEALEKKTGKDMCKEKPSKEKVVSLITKNDDVSVELCDGTKVLVDQGIKRDLDDLVMQFGDLTPFGSN